MTDNKITSADFKLLTFEEQVEHYENHIEEAEELETWEERLKLAIVGCMAGALFYEEYLLEFYNEYINLNRHNGRNKKTKSV